jgi:hypothetical protein
VQLPGETGIERIILALFAGLPAIIAAISSLKNGRTMKRNGFGRAVKPRKAPVKKRPSKNGQHPEWYQPPDL